MATQRMFSRLITETDRFLSMPPAAQSLYFHLTMNADDDGFVSSPTGVLSATRTSVQELYTLESLGLVIPFSSGILAITHWNIHRDSPENTYHPTLYQDEKQRITPNHHRAYECDHDCFFHPAGHHEVTCGTTAEEAIATESDDTLDEEMFLCFWNEYPKKKHLSDARTVWRLLRVDEKLFETILDAVQSQSYSAEWTAEDGKYIPLPADWLKSEGWKNVG